jgi:hypothetical protein
MVSALMRLSALQCCIMIYDGNVETKAAREECDWITKYFGFKPTQV